MYKTVAVAGHTGYTGRETGDPVPVVSGDMWPGGTSLSSLDNYQTVRYSADIFGTNWGYIRACSAYLPDKKKLSMKQINNCKLCYAPQNLLSFFEECELQRNLNWSLNCLN